MDSIFQIKINEKKLQQILADIRSSQWVQGEGIGRVQNQLDAIKKSIQNTDLKIRKDMMSVISNQELELVQKINEVKAEVQEKLLIQTDVWTEKITNMNQYLREIERSFAEKLEVFEKFQENMEVSWGKISDLKNRMDLKETKLEEIDGKIEKSIQHTQFLQESDFLHFMQLLIDKQLGYRMSNFSKDYENPLQVGNPNEKQKRFKELKEDILATQKKVKKIGNQMGEFKTVTTEEVRSNREEIHLHFAYLAKKIKEIEEKIGLDADSLKSRSATDDAIIYPSSHPRSSRQKASSRFTSLMGSAEKNLMKEVSLEFKLQSYNDWAQKEIALLQKDLKNLTQTTKQKINPLEDEVWSLRNREDLLRKKVEKIGNSLEQLKEGSFKKLAHNQQNDGTSHLKLKMMEEWLEEELEKKVDNSVFLKEREQIYSRIRLENEKFSQKANKEDTREAFHYIESKIREIVLLLANMQKNSKKTAASKKNLQCMSCDDNFYQEMNLEKLSFTPRHPKTPRRSINTHRRVCSNQKMVPFAHAKNSS